MAPSESRWRRRHRRFPGRPPSLEQILTQAVDPLVRLVEFALQVGQPPLGFLGAPGGVRCRRGCQPSCAPGSSPVPLRLPRIRRGRLQPWPCPGLIPDRFRASPPWPAAPRRFPPWTTPPRRQRSPRPAPPTHRGGEETMRSPPSLAKEHRDRRPARPRALCLAAIRPRRAPLPAIAPAVAAAAAPCFGQRGGSRPGHLPVPCP